MLRVAAIQMISGNDLETNLSAAKNLVVKAANAGAKLVVLPETFSLFSARKQYALGVVEASDATVVRKYVSQLAKEYQVWIVAGTIPVADVVGSEADSKRVFSSCFLFDDKGIEQARYNKMHMFDVDVEDQQGSYRESDTFYPGNEVVIVDTPFGRLGLAVCYDIRFPELFRVMFEKSVDIIAVPAAFTLKTGEAHWQPLLRARAIENQCYVIGANQGGRHSKSRETSGGSIIIDGWGSVVTEMGKGEDIVVADIKIGKLSELRDAMPCRQHMRFDFSAKF